MISKLFRKTAPQADLGRAGPPVPAEDEARAAVMEAEHAALRTEWETRLQSAMGNDAALLVVARDAPLAGVKHAAVLALVSEAALKVAEREFRTHDRRIHRAAKQRYEALARQREAREQAGKLIASASALLVEAGIPANRLVELDHAWRALDPGLLEESQKSLYAALLEQLTGRLRERGESQRALRRWLEKAAEAQEMLHGAWVGVAGATNWSGVGEAIAAAQAMAGDVLGNAPAFPDSSLPEGSEMVARMAALREAGCEAERIAAKVAILEALYRTDASASTPEGAAGMAAVQRWENLAAVADKGIDQALNAHFSAWLRGKADARKVQQAEQRQRAKNQGKAAQQAHADAVRVFVKSAEEALAGGHLAEAGKSLATAKEKLEQGAVDSELQARMNGIQAEYARLKGWQHWGGGRVRDDLVKEAEALVAAVSAAGEPGAVPLPVKQHAEAIEHLRAQWKELDRLGAATRRELWQQFDAALKTAYQPVVAHLDKLNAARRENRDARKSLMATLDAVELAGAEQGSMPDWRAISRVLGHFQVEWRKLGPLEHTVQHKDRDALLAQMKASVARLEEPLQEARRAAQSVREGLIANARALGEAAQSRDVVARVRALQAEWQQHAKVIPLAREVEHALWSEFKSALDAVFGQRDAAMKAKEAELQAAQDAREAMIARLEGLDAEMAAADVKRNVAEAEAEWRRAGEAPRAQAAGLESRFRAACAAALNRAAAAVQRKRDAEFSALLAKVAFCEEIEANALDVIPLEDVESRWAALPVLQPSWEQPLAARYQAAIENATGVAARPAPSGSEPLDAVLLRLEYGLDIPTPPAFQSERQAMKLQLMKSVLEGGQTASVSKPEIEKRIITALGCSHVNVEQSRRLASMITALRLRG